MYQDFVDNQLHNEIVAMLTNPILLKDYRYSMKQILFFIPLVAVVGVHFQENLLDNYTNHKTPVQSDN
jgi:hypothetical protein